MVLLIWLQNHYLHSILCEMQSSLCLWHQWWCHSLTLRGMFMCMCNSTLIFVNESLSSAWGDQFGSSKSSLIITTLTLVIFIISVIIMLRKFDMFAIPDCYFIFLCFFLPQHMPQFLTNHSQTWCKYVVWFKSSSLVFSQFFRSKIE